LRDAMKVGGGKKSTGGGKRISRGRKRTKTPKDAPSSGGSMPDFGSPRALKRIWKAEEGPERAGLETKKKKRVDWKPAAFSLEKDDAQRKAPPPKGGGQGGGLDLTVYEPRREQLYRQSFGAAPGKRGSVFLRRHLRRRTWKARGKNRSDRVVKKQTSSKT